MSSSDRIARSRRSVLAVPGSSTKMLEKAKGLAVDALFMDLEDAVAPLAKQEARENIVAALNGGGYGDKILTVKDEEIPDLAGLWRRVWSSGSAGAEVRLRIDRDGSPKRVSIRSADRASFLKSPKLH